MDTKTCVLIDASLTGGRGSAKQAYEFIQDCRDLKIPYIDRKIFGGWLTTLQYDELAGFVRRFVNDLGITAREKFFVLLDKELYQITQDLIKIAMRLF